MEISFLGKRALVTGASGGYGRAIAVALSKCGAKVVALGNSRPDLEELQAEIPSIAIIAADLRDWCSTQRALEDVGPIDLLVNAAETQHAKALHDLEEEDVDRVLSLNTKAVINVTQIAVRDMLARRVGGAIVNVSSAASMMERMSKGAVDAFTRAAALELGPHHIRVNCVEPTDLEDTWGNDAPPLEEPGDVVHAVLHLLSDKASMITGRCLPVASSTDVTVVD